MFDFAEKSRVYQILQLSCQFPNYRSKYGLSVKYTIVFTWCCDTCVGITPFEMVMSFLHVFADDDITSHLTTKLSGACFHYLPPQLNSIHCSQCVLNHPPFLQASTINFFSSGLLDVDDNNKLTRPLSFARLYLLMMKDAR